jgi:hypothetical protein
MNLLPIPLLEIFINSREAERYLSKPDFALVMIKITLALIKLSPKVWQLLNSHYETYAPVYWLWDF